MVKESSVRSPYFLFLNEIFGALIPGAFFLLCLVIVFFGPAVIILSLYSDATYSILDSEFVCALGKIDMSFMTSLFVLVVYLIFSFLFGSIYYSRPVLFPNQQSIFKLLCKDYVFLDMIGKRFRFYVKLRLRNAIIRALNGDEATETDIDGYLRRHYAINGLSGIGVVPFFSVRERNSGGNNRSLAKKINRAISDRVFSEEAKRGLFGDCILGVIPCGPATEDEFAKNFEIRPLYKNGCKKVHIKFPYTDVESYLRNKEYDNLLHVRDQLPIGSLKYGNFVNCLKMSCCNDVNTLNELIHIEGYIRYSSSMWYIAKSVQKMCGWICLASFLSLVPLFFSTGFSAGDVIAKNAYLFGFIALSFIGCFLVCFRFSNYIENYLHNQRLKEIIAALEIWAVKKNLLQI